MGHETDVLTELDLEAGHRVEILETSLDDKDGDRFVRIGSLGKGGMGEVQLHRDLRISRLVAVKVLRNTLRDHQGSRERFLREARIQGQLEHPAIVPVHDLGITPDGEPYFSMKCVRGITLRQALRRAKLTTDEPRDPKLTRRRLLGAFASMCLAVEYAHSRGVVHRDLKPENVMLGDFGEVYVLDWGIAKLLDQADTPITDNVVLPDGNDTPTQAGAILGTPRYMAPERAQAIANARSDIFALGKILGEICEVEQDPIPELTTIVARATAPDPAARHESARELHDELERYLDGDRDLIARRKLAEDHARRAETALLQPATAERRTEAARDIARSLGLDPTNESALHTMMKLLTDVPTQLPPAAEAELAQRLRSWRRQTLKSGTLLTLSGLIFVPVFVAMGVLDWSLIATYVLCLVSATACQSLAVRENSSPLWRIPAIMLQLAAMAILSTSMGLLGAVPASLTVITAAWRINLDRGLHGLLLLLAAAAAVLIPTLLWSSTYSVHDGVIEILPRMHRFPPGATIAFVVVGTIGALGIAVLYGRLYVNEIRRAEHRLVFQAWQLEQMVPRRQVDAQ